MKLYGLNNIVKCGTNIYYINIVGERLHLLNVNCKTLYGVTIDKEEIDLIDDVEMSDWLLNNLFDKEKDGVWCIDYLHNEGVKDFPYHRIEKDESGECYMFTRQGKFLMYIDYIRELQNAIHFYRDMFDGEFLYEDIDEKLKKLFKLI